MGMKRISVETAPEQYYCAKVRAGVDGAISFTLLALAQFECPSFYVNRMYSEQDRWAAPVAADDANVKLFRPALAQTNFEFRPLTLQYNANVDGWSASAFHAAVDRQGPAVVFCRSKTGGVFGGYNPKG
jgi:hypothetical protein